MKKVSQLKNIRSREPHVLRVQKGNFEPDVLHIVRREGDFPKPNGHLTERVTNCGRILDYGAIFTGNVRNTSLKLCSRCGTVEDFATAIREYNENWRKFQDQQNAERARIMADIEKAHAVYMDVLRKLEDSLRELESIGITASVDERHSRLLIVIDGHKLQVTPDHS